MPSNKRSEKREHARDTTPSIMSAAGLLSFYEEEDAKIKLSPVAVMIIAAGFIAAIIGLDLLAKIM
ncbi:Sec61beta family protein [Pyrolobus fumarii 1A]|uniref:Sec61beta family protein n=1 Tax=Pyrolobus fumarii (strain DSM 11204 / 1A) TaxID=694429 RepID=G0EEI7_PYRF1|nr:preprotein translocase subunit Sec61beta [Pyrolobus fumarii]AEM38028.1 Sec61beta family protein [Pyrolobus fumarii 1A]